MASGRFDSIVPQDNAERLAALLREAGADVTLRWQNTGHGLENEEIVAARTWLSQLTLNEGDL
jgi:phospholipase/carboxylesterase